MFSKTSKIIAIIYGVFILLMLFSGTAELEINFVFMSILTALVLSIFLAIDVKKSRGDLITKIFSLVGMDLVLYLLAAGLFLGVHETQDAGVMVYALLRTIITMLAIVSLVTGIIINVIKRK